MVGVIRDRARHAATVLLLASALTEANLARAQDIDACIEASAKARTLRKARKLIDARTSLSRCSASACPDAVGSFCRQRLAEVVREIPSIVFVAKDGRGRDLAAVKLSIDGAVFADHLDGSSIELDPGEHVFRFEYAGQEPVVERFVLREGEHDRRETILIGPGPTPTSEADSQTERADTQRTIALVVTGAGVAGLITGGVFGALTISAHNEYEQDCGSNIGAPPGQCTAQGFRGEGDAANKGNLATAFFIAGGLATAAGAVWYFLAPSGRKDVRVGIEIGGFVVSGEF
jgi:hypothetical protein